jgi:hypothetical protein
MSQRAPWHARNESRALTLFSLLLTMLSLLIINRSFRSFSTFLVSAFRRTNDALA